MRKVRSEREINVEGKVRELRGEREGKGKGMEIKREKRGREKKVNWLVCLRELSN